eukprot:CAMPEP_0182880910 /NCGR_PEP_ID=MMETSP0034_2-20130328/16855_1 /TAXON_ID=156128 /ORGANISM="Nephroselmis pyriformis, Strain CCMP717" /LENGTH=124 /DNA_ID=CAMNT_0025013917 /DNA_START=31 /DNA_END=402 /DNA_ORIENTATION=-
MCLTCSSSSFPPPGRDHHTGRRAGHRAGHGDDVGGEAVRRGGAVRLRRQGPPRLQLEPRRHGMLPPEGRQRLVAQPPVPAVPRDVEYRAPVDGPHPQVAPLPVEDLHQALDLCHVVPLGGVGRP